jgi:mannose-6-phosphate isomerase-like protein (cupin superfamily)
MQVRRVVTAVRPEGLSVFSSDTLGEPLTFRALPGLEFFPLWATRNGHPVIDTEPDVPAGTPYWPAPGETRFLLVRWIPEKALQPAVDETGDLDVDELLPGLMGAFEVDNPGFHTSASVDYGVCLEGEMVLELDDNQEVVLHPGDCVVQRGTRHVWRNRSDVPALMMYVLVGADPA